MEQAEQQSEVESEVGFVTKGELREKLRNYKEFDELSNEELDYIFKRLDINNDGFVNITELKDIANAFGSSESEAEIARVQAEIAKSKLKKRKKKDIPITEIVNELEANQKDSRETK